MKKVKKISCITLAVFIAFTIQNCTSNKHKEPADNAQQLQIDGSSTLYPITAELVDQYKYEFDNFEINIGVSGTGGGFQKFIEGKTNINNASRRISDKEITALNDRGIVYREFEVAIDGIAVVVNPQNNWVNDLTVQELQKIWKEGGARRWSDVRSDWPSEEITLYGPGEASGTFDYFQKVIITDGDIKTNYVKSENDNLLARALANNKNAIGYFGLGYYREYKDKLKLIAVDNGNGPVTPTKETVASGAYTPLSRKMYLYTTDAFCQDPNGRQFLNFYFENASNAVEKVGYVSLPASSYKSTSASFQL